MIRQARLGFIPLTDCAPLAVAEAKGLFAAEGLDVALSREASWATVRDKVAVGALDGAHMLAPMALAAAFAAWEEPAPLVVPLALSLNGSAVTVGTALAEALRRADPDGTAARTARPLARLIAARREVGAAPLTFAVVFPFSVHNYLLRTWLAEGGVDPDVDVRLVVTPPPRVAEQLRAGVIDGFCVGSPWSAVAEADGAGRTLACAPDILPDGPDKVLALGAGFAAREPATVRAILRALLRAGAWADARENRDELCAILAQPRYVGVEAELIGRSIDETGLVFAARGAAEPRPDHAEWFVAQMRRWRQVAEGARLDGGVYRPDLYRLADQDLGA